MAINYIEKGRHLHDEVRRQGRRLEQRDGIWEADDEAAVQLIIDTYDTLPEIKKDKRQAAKAQALVLANAIYDGAGEDVVFNDAAHIRLIVDIDASYRPVAGGIRPRLTQLLAVWSAFQAIKTEINQLGTAAAVEAYDVVNNVLWP